MGKYNFCIMGWMLSSPLATIEGMIDVVINVRKVRTSVDGKTSGIDIRHFLNVSSS